MSYRASGGTNGTNGTSGAAWGVGAWGVGTAALLVAMPLAASGRLPERVATHWGGLSGPPDGSMPLWAAALFPALIWAVLVLAVAIAARRTGGAARGWVAGSLLSGGVLLAGAQASIVRANLDHEDWRQAESATGWVVVVFVAAALAALGGVLVGRRGAVGSRGPAVVGPSMDIPSGERLVWLSRASNAWLQLIAAVAGLVAVAGALAGLGGLMGSEWLLVAPFALASLLALAFSSVRARVTGRGLEVAFGPLGLPVRRWAAEDIESAWVEERTAARVGGWGYRLNGLGTTVMLRGGECLVVRSKGKDFAVSVDDAERGAALLNSLGGRPTRP
ncbi:DUF1648 domain-containing protein [Streptomyces sp. NPDC059835]|uniref:DUF1648 domain-containing protein n=1 Tax=Streptomyces sp. NPDC059835 TaxID=3346967 RepID=UPI00365F8C4D